VASRSCGGAFSSQNAGPTYRFFRLRSLHNSKSKVKAIRTDVARKNVLLHPRGPCHEQLGVEAALGKPKAVGQNPGNGEAFVRQLGGRGCPAAPRPQSSANESSANEGLSLGLHRSGRQQRRGRASTRSRGVLDEVVAKPGDLRVLSCNVQWIDQSFAVVPTVPEPRREAHGGKSPVDTFWAASRLLDRAKLIQRLSISGATIRFIDDISRNLHGCGA
jgi:hypothetical protein